MIFTNMNDEVQNKSLAKDIQFCIEYAKKMRTKFYHLYMEVMMWNTMILR